MLALSMRFKTATTQPTYAGTGICFANDTFGLKLTPWEDTTRHHCKWFSESHGKVNNAVCGLIRMEAQDQRASLQLLAQLPFCPQLRIEFSL